MNNDPNRSALNLISLKEALHSTILPSVDQTESDHMRYSIFMKAFNNAITPKENSHQELIDDYPKKLEAFFNETMQWPAIQEKVYGSTSMQFVFYFTEKPQHAKAFEATIKKLNIKGLKLSEPQTSSCRSKGGFIVTLDPSCLNAHLEYLDKNKNAWRSQLLAECSRLTAQSSLPTNEGLNRCFNQPTLRGLSAESKSWIGTGSYEQVAGRRGLNGSLGSHEEKIIANLKYYDIDKYMLVVMKETVILYLHSWLESLACCNVLEQYDDFKVDSQDEMPPGFHVHITDLAPDNPAFLTLLFREKKRLKQKGMTEDEAKELLNCVLPALTASVEESCIMNKKT